MNKPKTAQVILAIDYGSKSTGLAVASGVRISKPLKSLDSTENQNLIDGIKTIIEDLKVDLVVIGQPLNMRGETSQQSLTVEKFKLNLSQQIAQPIIFQAETDTTNLVKQELGLDSIKLKSAKESGQIDALAAARILQDYLDQYGFSIPKNI
ncbi:MAG TPA: Holliday junction resolvase RuvX [Candidatus Saccharibacteria bacterium]|nr:Holliday junction resolvase RuvX [Candidatus Saccharibacteria bacterium]